jgi:hypothetical protein
MGIAVAHEYALALGKIEAVTVYDKMTDAARDPDELVPTRRHLAVDGLLWGFFANRQKDERKLFFQKVHCNILIISAINLY